MKDCEFCGESKLKVGDKTKYGAVVIYRIGDDKKGWFATLSPKTGGDPKTDFAIQLMPFAHLKYFSEINSNLGLAKNYGVAFAKLNQAIGKIIQKQGSESKTVPIGIYGKCKHEDEHIHIKIFPYRGNIGQPFTTDSSFARKEIYNDKNGEKFVKMKPVKKVKLSEKRFKQLAGRLMSLLK